ncbi:MAG TPA: DUF502 domain-containing protein [Acidobacteriota bacterium]|nr:DUF502 domain-containing protein [Acidobacteriota bacterium]
MKKKRQLIPAHLQRYVITGTLVLVPIWVTWMVFSFLFGQLSKIGLPWVRGISAGIEQTLPTLSAWLSNSWVQSVLAALLTLVLLYLLGLVATRVVGRRLLSGIESLIQNIPFIQTVYGATKKLIVSLQHKPENVKRVVLIEFPTPEMRAVGFVTKVLTDHKTGKKLAAVYVPTTPNPTSGYLEIVPLERVVSTDWSVDEAMTFVISGGAVSPETINYDNDTAVPDKTAKSGSANAHSPDPPVYDDRRVSS